jgi:hypothetical protein
MRIAKRAGMIKAKVALARPNSPRRAAPAPLRRSGRNTPRPQKVLEHRKPRLEPCRIKLLILCFYADPVGSFIKAC